MTDRSQQQQQQQQQDMTTTPPPANSQSETEEWPNLYMEACEMTLASISTFAIADLRWLARNKQLGDDGDEEVLCLPMTGDEMYRYWKEYQDKLSQARVRSSDYSSLVEPYMMDNSIVEYHLSSAKIHHVGDENASRECVYTIVTNSIRKRIVLSFRGSITIKDWIQDAKTVMSDIPNPAKILDQRQPETIGVHMGFRDYLYGKSPFLLGSSLPKSLPLPKSFRLPNKAQQDEKEQEKEKEEEETVPSKMQVILTQIKALREEHPDYKIYVTGHSLGGALALICALEAAVAFDGPPVTCITIGNPKAGNLQFRAAIRMLEGNKRLRCFCVHNDLDIVPRMPHNVMDPHDNFCHVGLNMKLYKHGFDIVYKGGHDSKPQCETACLRNCIKNCCCCCVNRNKKQSFSRGRLNRHNYREYLERLMKRRDELSELNMNDLYKKKMKTPMP